MTSLTHLHLHVRDRTVAATFYADWLGMRVKWRGDALTFMTGDDGFDLALMDDPAPAPMPPWFHFGFRLASPQVVIDLLERMQAADVVLAKPLYQDPTLVSFRCRDRDDYLIEIYWQPEAVPPPVR